MITSELNELPIDISQNQINIIISELICNFIDAAIETFGKIGQQK